MPTQNYIFDLERARVGAPGRKTYGFEARSRSQRGYAWQRDKIG